MTVEFDRSSPSDFYRAVLSSPAREQRSSWAPSRDPEKAGLVDDGDLTLVVSPPPSRWPRIFPSL